MKDIPAAHGVTRGFLRNVVHLPHLDRRDVTVLGQAGRNRSERRPLVGRRGGHRDFGRLEHQVGGADRPFVSAAEVERRRQVGRIAKGRTGIRPDGNFRDLFLGQGGIVLVMLNTEVPFYKPGWHAPSPVAECCPVLHGARPGPGLLVGEKRHRRHRSGPVALLAALLQDRCDVLGESYLGRGLGLGARGETLATFERRCIPPGRRCSSVVYGQYAPSSRLVSRAPHRSRCYAGFHHGLQALAGRNRATIGRPIRAMVFIQPSRQIQRGQYPRNGARPQSSVAD